MNKQPRDNYQQDPAAIALVESILPPHSVEAEQTVLGAILYNPMAMENVAELLKPAHFYRTSHVHIYQAMCDLFELMEPIDVITVTERMVDKETLDAAGGRAYVMDLAASVSTADNALYYAKIIVNKSILRQLVNAGQEIAHNCMQPINPEEAIDRSQQLIFDIAQHGIQNDSMPMSKIAPSVIENIKFRRDNKEHLLGLSTGFYDLDNFTSGLQKSDLIVLAARPSMGKAQDVDAPVLMADGEWARMGDLRIGDALASHDGQSSIVTDIFPQGIKDIYKLIFSDGRTAECCAEHLWRVGNRKWDEPRVMSLQQIITLLEEHPSYQDRLYIDLVSGDFGHDKALPIDPWTMGALLGNCCFKRPSLQFSTRESATLVRVAGNAGPLALVNHVAGTDYRIVKSNLTKPLIKMGLKGLYSHETFIPEIYLSANKNARLELLRGLIDTNGWVEQYGSIRYSSSSKRLALDVQTLVRSLGGLCEIREKRPTYTHKGEKLEGKRHYICKIRHLEPETLVTLQSKKRRARTKGLRLTISKIEKVRQAQAQCIAVSHPDHLYITDNYVVTHNTAFCMNIAANVARGSGGRVLFFSLEMDKESVVTRMLCSEAEVNAQSVRNGTITDYDLPKLMTAMGAPLIERIHIDDTPGLSVMEMRAKARKAQQQIGEPFGLIIVDYLQLMESRSGGEENRTQEISKISRGLKGLAREMKVPVLALSQLSRAVESRQDKRPMLSDLRESGAIEQDADLVMFIYRDEYYNKESERPGMADIIIAKQRNGPVGQIELLFRHQMTRFYNPSDRRTTIF